MAVNKRDAADKSNSQDDTAMAKAMADATAKAQAQADAEALVKAQAEALAKQQSQNGNPGMAGTDKPQFLTGNALLENYRPRFAVADQGDADVNVMLATVRELERKTKEANGGKESVVKYHTIPKSVTGSFSALVVSVQQVINNQTVIGVQTLIMESSRPPLEALTQQTPLGAIEVVLSPVEAFTAEFIDVVHKEVGRYYQGKGSIVDAGMQVIYRETPFREEATVAQVLNEATQAIDSTLRHLDPMSKLNRFNLGQVVGNPHVRITSKFSLGEELVQANGLPIRSDITSELQMQINSNSKQTIQTQTTMNLTRTAAYVDLIYTAPAQMYGHQTYTGQSQYHYIPRITMTELGTEMAGSSMEFVLLGIANKTSLNRNRGYGIQFRDSYVKNQGTVLRNLGAIGFQMPHLNTTPGQEGQPANLSIESEADLQRLINTAINPSPVYSLEVEQAGRNGWLLETFAQAATTNVVANKQIVQAADALTNGRFTPIYARNCGVSIEQASSVQVIRTTKDLNHIGYYKKGDGSYADLRELDLLAILNIANGNVELVRDYLATVVTSSGEHALQRLDKRLRIFRTICSEVVVKGYCSKYDFTGHFIKSLIEAIEATGFVLNATNTLLNSQQQVYTQTVQDWASTMVDPNVGSGLYQTNTFTPQGAIYNVGQNTGFGFYR